MTPLQAVNVANQHRMRTIRIDGNQLDILVYEEYTKRTPSGFTYGSTMLRRIAIRDIYRWLGY
jgi:hypothetical protein